MTQADLMIIHAPQPWVEFRGEKRYFEENIEAWKAMEDAYKAGKLKSIGVSNFLVDDLQNILEHSEIKPMINQILCHVSNTPEALIKFCEDNDIIVEAYSPIAHGAAANIPEVVDMAKKYNVTLAQLCIKYDLQLGLVVLPKTANPEHMKTNASLDFTISDEDMEVLKNANYISSYGEDGFFPVFDKGQSAL